MPRSHRALCRAVFSPLVAAPLGLLLGCGGSPDLPHETPAAPRLLAPELVVTQSLVDASRGGPLWRATAASYGRPDDEEGVFRLPAVAGRRTADVPRLGQASPGPRFPDSPNAQSPTWPSVVVPPKETDLAAPSELVMGDEEDVRSLPVMAGQPPAAESVPPLPSPAASLERWEPESPLELQAPPQLQPAPAAEHVPQREAEPRGEVEPPLRPTPLPWAEVASTRNPAMRAVSERAAQQVRSGFVLANRGAYYSARSEFVAALRAISQALDASAGGRAHGEALAAGLRALEESDDFVPRGAQVEADLDLKALLPAHQTPVLKDRPLEAVTPLVARRMYYTYAQEQLALAAGRERAGSMALYSLAKLQIALEAQNPMRHTSAAPKAMALHQAALLTDGSNYLAANELGVLLARFGQYQQARDVLLHSVHQAPLPSAWHNLAVVHHHLGEPQLAASAEQQAQRLAQSSAASQIAGEQSAVVWTTPAAFAQSSDTGQAPAVRTAAPVPAHARSGSLQR